MRAVALPKEGILTLRDRYGNVRAEFRVNAGENLLPITNNVTFLENEEGRKIFIYEGMGVLAFEDTKNYLNLTRAHPQSLDSFFLGRLEYRYLNQAELDFLAVYEKNIEKKSYYLTPPRFLDIEKRLIYGF